QGVPVIDTDQIARSLTLPGGAALPAIAEAFGQDMLLADGSLDRARMRARVFADPAAKKLLEAITHPLIEAEVRRRIAAAAAPYLVVDIPLLVETDARRRYALNQVLVIDCPESLQIARVMARNGHDRQAVEAIMAAQAPRQRRLAVADEIIDNTGTLAQLAQAIADCHQRFLALAQAR
ncbi:MAG: dephospho-CoA kinase, partial [Zoogloeaceae bacterium]|nr:dephospho-CoA kinase [Zoogloeaceae bacterium]